MLLCIFATQLYIVCRYFVGFLLQMFAQHIFFIQYLQVSKYMGFAISAPSITVGPSKYSLQEINIE